MDGANPKPDDDMVLFSAELRPYRSLSRRGFVMVMASIGGLSFGAGLVFFAMGAWPVVGFLGLDVALVWYAFRANYIAARARECVLVRRSEIVVSRVDARGGSAEWRFNPYWVRLHVDRDGDGEVRRLALASHGRRLDVAGFLPTPDRTAFARALDAALAAARRGAPAPA